MLLCRRDFRTIVYYEYVKNSSASDCRDSLVRLFGDIAPSLEVIREYYRDFDKTRAYLDECEVPHTRTITTEYVDGVRRLLRNDPRVRLCEIQDKFKIGPVALRKIIDEFLEYTKRYGLWVPKVLSVDEKKQRTDWARLFIKRFENGCSDEIKSFCTGGEIWIYRYESQGSEGGAWSFGKDEIWEDSSGQDKILEKQIVACFFSKAGYIATIPLGSNFRSLTVSALTDFCLPQLMSTWAKKHAESKQDLYIHHEFTRSYTAAKTVKFIHNHKSRLLPHPPHSPDLAPADYFLFNGAKEALAGKTFSSAKEAIAALQAHIDGLGEDTWPKAFDEWWRRIRKCMNKSGGDYFEEL